MKRIFVLLFLVLALAGMVCAVEIKSKAEADAKIAVLKTEEGKVALVAQKIAEIDAVKAKLKQKAVGKNQISMRDFLEVAKQRIVKDPNSLVAAEIKVLTAKSIELVKAEPNSIEKPVIVEKPK
jgi:hypothetical protein